MNIRVSAGTAMHMGLMKGGLMEHPTTAYLMIPGGVCRGGCTFCPQAKGDSRWLSRVSWPQFDLELIVEGLQGSDFERICLQCPDIDGYEEKIIQVVNDIADIGIPVSVSSPPLTDETLDSIQDKIDMLGIGIDGATDEIRARVKTNYHPQLFWDYLGRAIDRMGPNKVTAHFIVGLGENLPQLVLGTYRAFNAGANVSLFSYTSKDASVDLRYYRQAQMASHLLTEGLPPSNAIDLVLNNPKELADKIYHGDMFRTQGCPGCNRPYYTTRPGEEHKNYPRPLDDDELNSIKEVLGCVR